MTTVYTSLLGLALPVTGELSGTWGDTVNTAITTLLDSAIAGTTTLSTDADVTLTTTTGAANTSRQAILLCSGARTVLRTITAPAQSKIYTVINSTTGGFSVKIVGAGPTTGVTIVAGESALIAWNGSDFTKISNTGGSASFTNVTVTGTTTLSGLTASTALALDASKNVVSVTNTGTGSNVLAVSPTLTGTIAGASLSLSSLTSGRVTYAGTGGLLQDSANLTFNGTTLTANTLNLTNALGTAYGGTGLTSFTSGGVVYASSTSALATGSALTFDGTNLNVGIGGVGKVQIGTASSGTFQTALYASNGVDTDFQIRFKTGLTEFGTGTSTPLAFSFGGSEQMRLTSTGLGIGTSSPSQRLDVVTTTAAGLRVATSTSAASTASLYLAVANNFSGTSQAYIQCIGSGNSGVSQLAFATARAASDTTATEAMRIDSSGNLLVGATSSDGVGASRLQIGNSSAATAGLLAKSTSSSISLYASSTSGAYQVWKSGTFMAFGEGPDNLGSFTERARIDSSGNLLVGATDANGFKAKIQFTGTNGLRLDTTNTSAALCVQFVYNATTQVGTIATTTTSTTYNTSSDYRLKENVQPMTGALAKVSAFKPVTYKWKSNGFNGEGFIAHELAEVCPDAVTGKKDAVDENGNIKPQGIDTSFLVATLTAAIQEQQAIIESLKARLDAANL